MMDHWFFWFLLGALAFSVPFVCMGMAWMQAFRMLRQPPPPPELPLFDAEAIFAKSRRLAEEHVKWLETVKCLPPRPEPPLDQPI